MKLFSTKNTVVILDSLNYLPWQPTAFTEKPVHKDISKTSANI